MISLILGGARSGKSSFAEQEVLLKAQSQTKNACYLATATAFDQEMAARIQLHQQQRQQQRWQTIECPTELIDTIKGLDDNKVYLLDCITLWLNNLIYQQSRNSNDYEHNNQAINHSRQLFIDALSQCSSDLTIVSNEVGFGIVPMGQECRLFVDHLGWLNQQIAKLATKVTLVCAGIPMTLKDVNNSKGKCND